MNRQYSSGSYADRYNRYQSRPVPQAQYNALITRVFGWMGLGLGITAVSAMAVIQTGLYRMMLQGPMYWVLFAAELGLVVYLSARIRQMSVATATAAFLGYSALNGVTLSLIFLMYTSASIAMTFFITAGMFGGMFLYGWKTKRDLTSMGGLMTMGLIGFILASVVNIFLQSPMLYWISTYAGVAIFVGLTAWDAQKIKRLSATRMDAETHEKMALLGALTLYLDFINLFFLMLRILGDRR